MTRPGNVPPPRPQPPAARPPDAGSPRPATALTPAGTNLFCPVCGHEFLPDELGKKPHCRHCGYLES